MLLTISLLRPGMEGTPCMDMVGIPGIRIEADDDDVWEKVAEGVEDVAVVVGAAGAGADSEPDTTKKLIITCMVGAIYNDKICE